MTRQNFEQVYWLKKELKMWQKKLTDLQADIALSPKVLDGMPFQNTNETSDPTAMKAIKLEEIEKVISGKIAEIQLAVAEIDAYIVTIDDSLLRQIIEYRCCKLLTWDEIAGQMGGNMTPENARQIYHRFLNNLEDA